MKPTITDKALKTLKTKRDAFDTGVNAGIKYLIDEEWISPERLKKDYVKASFIYRDTTSPQTKWQDIGPRFNVAGVQYGDYQLIAGGLNPGTVVQLIGEPNNPHDSRAIRIEYNGIKLGYVPKALTIPSYDTMTLRWYMWDLHKAGYKQIAVVTQFNKSNPTHEMITVQVKYTTNGPLKPVTPCDIKF